MQSINERKRMPKLKFYKDIVISDFYCVRQYDYKCFTQVVDVGASTGAFTVLCAFLFPFAKISSYEPDIVELEPLNINISNLRSSITLYQEALGSGKTFYFKGDHIFCEEKTDKFSCPSLTIKQILDRVDYLNNKVLLKIDCEGGERFMFDDIEGINAMKSIHHIALEIHFPNPKYRAFDNLPSYSIHNQWVRNNFTKTHNILYHQSKRSHGFGHFILTKKY
jgi:FkbM family methyltransferase